MPKREDETARQVFYGGHPPACTCAECTKRRLRELQLPERSYSYPKRKSFLIFLLVACLGALIYAGYLLFTHKTDPVIGTIILAADIGVLIWNISVLRKWKVGARTIVAIAVVIAVLGATTGAFAGIQPFSTAKNELVTWFQKAPSQPSEQQLPPSAVPIPSSTPTPPASECPADISAEVIITNTVLWRNFKLNKQNEMIPIGENRALWVVEISVKNNSYEKPITAVWDKSLSLSMPVGREWAMWSVVVDDEIVGAPEGVDIHIPPPMSVD
ncbi:MAG: hypothetical protein J7K77_03440, partial [Dehalococcoidales bacterium]|nr:hypothetical protein [Dehalococcoidales bacterium]